MSMTISQFQSATKSVVFDALFSAVEGAVQFDNGKFAIPVKVDGIDAWVKVALVTAKSDFDLDKEVRLWHEKTEKAEKRERERAEKRAQKEKEKASA